MNTHARRDLSTRGSIAHQPRFMLRLGKTQSAPGSMSFGRLRTFPEVCVSRAGSYLVQCGFPYDETAGHASLFNTVEARSRIHLNFFNRLHLGSQCPLRDSRFPRRSLFASIRPTRRSHTVESVAWTIQRPHRKFIFNDDGGSSSRYKRVMASSKTSAALQCFSSRPTNPRNLHRTPAAPFTST